MLFDRDAIDGVYVNHYHVINQRFGEIKRIGLCWPYQTKKRIDYILLLIDYDSQSINVDFNRHVNKLYYNYHSRFSRHFPVSKENIIKILEELIEND
jgi:hypothetical protein